jgi:hypothetical protein
MEITRDRGWSMIEKEEKSEREQIWLVNNGKEETERKEGRKTWH